MALVELVVLLALLQFMFFIYLVGHARGTYGVKAPATTGHDIFERHFRVQQNTLENMLLFLPSLWIAAIYWNPTWVAAIGAVYLIGRAVYAYTYVNDPRRRTIGYLLTMASILVLFLAAAYGVVRALI